ncbi:MAG TPA: triose-phosphate isomerase [Azospirillaceae bacterium]|nr:triose-phosphate isomerase [Azospirillaceae bacterium]
MTVRRKLIAGNWKMNGSAAMTRDLIGALTAKAAAAAPACDVAVCPPYPFLGAAAAALAGSPVALGAQDCAVKVSGAHTGDVAAEMLADVGCRYAIVGHSERRADHGESDALIAAKAAAAHRAGLIAIICIGETEAERVAGRALDVASAQLAGSIPAGATAENTVIAYEPVWAIGTGKTATPADVAEMHAHIRGQLAGKIADADKVRILYGGSVKASNAAELLAVDNVDGALVGGASLVAADFWAIVEAA